MERNERELLARLAAKSAGRAHLGRAVSVGLLRLKKRYEGIVATRQIAMWLLMRVCGWRDVWAAEVFGKSRTTAVHAVAVLSEEMTVNKRRAAEIDKAIAYFEQYCSDAGIFVK